MTMVIVYNIDSMYMNTGITRYHCPIGGVAVNITDSTGHSQILQRRIGRVDEKNAIAGVGMKHRLSAAFANQMKRFPPNNKTIAGFDRRGMFLAVAAKGIGECHRGGFDYLFADSDCIPVGGVIDYRLKVIAPLDGQGAR